MVSRCDHCDTPKNYGYKVSLNFSTLVSHDYCKACLSGFEAANLVHTSRRMDGIPMASKKEEEEEETMCEKIMGTISTDSDEAEKDDDDEYDSSFSCGGCTQVGLVPTIVHEYGHDKGYRVTYLNGTTALRCGDCAIADRDNDNAAIEEITVEDWEEMRR